MSGVWIALGAVGSAVTSVFLARNAGKPAKRRKDSGDSGIHASDTGATPARNHSEADGDSGGGADSSGDGGGGD